MMKLSLSKVLQIEGDEKLPMSFPGARRWGRQAGSHGGASLCPGRGEAQLYWGTFHEPIPMKREFTTHSASETIALGRTLAASLHPPKLVLLRGNLGAGKTTLVKGIAEGFGAARAEDVTSPTFTLIHEYRGPGVILYHIDLYRIETQRELDTLAIDDLIGPDSVLLIEWGEKFPRFVAERDVEIVLENLGEDERGIWVVG